MQISYCMSYSKLPRGTVAPCVSCSSNMISIIYTKIQATPLPKPLSFPLSPTIISPYQFYSTSSLRIF